MHVSALIALIGNTEARLLGRLIGRIYTRNRLSDYRIGSAIRGLAAAGMSEHVSVAPMNSPVTTSP